MFRNILKEGDFMKRLKRMLFGMAAFLVLTAGVKAQATEKYYPDPTQPFATITDMSVSSKTVHAGDTLNYSLTLNDHDVASYYIYTSEGNRCEPSYIQVVWSGPDKKQKIDRWYEWEETKVGNRHIIKDKIKISRGRTPGKWKIGAIWIWSRSIEDDGEELYIGNSTTGVTKEDCTYTDMSALDFTVEGTKADNKSPKAFYKSMKLSKKKVKKNEKVKFSVKVTDQNKIESVSCRWIYVPNRRKKSGEFYEDEVDNTYKMKYNKKTKLYEYTFRGSKEKKSLMYLESITVKDEYGNKETYGLAYGSKKWRKAVKKMVFYRK